MGGHARGPTARVAAEVHRTHTAHQSYAARLSETRPSAGFLLECPVPASDGRSGGIPPLHYYQLHGRGTCGGVSSGLKGTAMEWDIDRELIALDTCLADFEHPLSLSVRTRALALAAGIVAGAPVADRSGVATRLERTLRRHGITECCHLPPEAPTPARQGLSDSGQGRTLAG